MATELLKRDEFRAWLETNTEKVVGTTFDSCDCPITRYLKEETGGKYVSTTEREIRIDGLKYAIPLWARIFIEETDGSQPEVFSGVRGADALRVLDAIGE